ncbi:YveK family protein [Clostridium fallax]|uniref:Capsular polysaccharide biosynthesis protein n=1 Tax=Clostridium fallax TaxID=1533 RepID=A0A1M4WQP5_9CLOT|nr:Wzz/FepE/Etk N-terminal domain-containing protein [Clostridium fallax]SHE83545.1 Capsular polysaccharide biosynthesis protein [Clostridium fallax]SQB06278.1 Cps19aC [Clostridium fallax]
MEDEITLDICKIMNLLKKNKKLIIFITAIFTTIVTVTVFFIIKPTFETKSTLVIKSSNFKENEYFDELQAAIDSQKIVKTYGKIGESRTVRKQIIDNLNLNLKVEDFDKKIEILPLVDTQILEITVIDTDPNLVYRIAEEFNKIFIKECEDKYNVGKLEVLDKPIWPIDPVKPNKKLNVFLGFIVGLVLSIITVLVKENINQKLKTEEDIEKYLKLPVIAVIPEIKED